MKPTVREKLLEIAQEFKEFLGLSDLEVKDITVSGSNAAYTYTPHSDIDLHLVVDIPRADQDEVYRELFDAKKYAFNDMHNIKIGGYDVELYVENANKPPVSKGVFSIVKDDWINISRQRKATIDDDSVRSKYEDIKHRIEDAIASNDSIRISSLAKKIKAYRQAGLDKHGELGSENLSYKMLRNQGYIDKLYKARSRARDAELSLNERRKKKKKAKVKYGFGGYWYPGYAYSGGTSDSAGDAGGGGDGGGGESVKEVSLTPDGVSPSTKMFLSEKDIPDQTEIIFDFMKFAVDELDLQNVPTLKIKKDPQWSVIHKSFGRYRDDLGQIDLAVGNRHIMDVLRTLAHELQHRKQDEREHMPQDAGATGSRFENEAHAVAGVLMRRYADMHPEYFKDIPVAESSGYIPTRAQAKDPRFKMALTVDVHPGQTGQEANKMALKTDAQGKPNLLMKTVNLREGRAYDGNNPPGPETPPTMPAGTVRVDVSDVYDWYKLGQHISNMKGLGKHDFGAGPPSSIISFGDEETEHQFIKDLEATGLDVTDIDPKDPQQPAGMRKIKTDPTYNVDEEDDLVESLRREFELLEDEVLGEIKMTSSNLSKLAAQIPGALVGLEFEMIVPGTRRSNFKDVALDFMKAMNMDSVAVGEYHGSGGYEQWDGGGWVDTTQDDYSGDLEQDWDADESVYDIDSILSFFNDGDYNSRRDISNLRDELQAEFQDYWSEQLGVLWDEQGFEYFQNYIENNDSFDRDDAMITARDEIAEANPDLDTDSEEFQSLLSNRVDEMEMQFVQDSWDEGSRGYNSDYDQAQSEFNDEMMQNISEDDWLTAAGYRRMSDIVDRFDITWPYWNDSQDASSPAEKPLDMFTIETDGSLDPNDPSSELGLEFVSPPIPLKDVDQVMKQVQQWAAKYGAYTGKANKTSMHANISVPGYDLQNLDYLKAAILLGDEYVLREFDRIGNTYAEPAIEQIKQLVRQRPDKVKQLLDRMKTDLNARASKLIHSGETGKYTSINTKDNRIEFRSPGGDYLSDIADNPQKMQDTINRMVVVLDAAMDPNKYKQEYQKKLYKVLTGQTFGREAETGAKQQTKDDDKDLLNIFTRYAAGELPKQALKSFVRQAQLQRSVAKGKQTGPMWWNVEWENTRSIEVVASNAQEAVAAAAREWGINPMSAAGQSLRATPLRPYQGPAPKSAGPTVNGRPSNPDGNFVIVSSTSRTPVYRFMAADAGDADTVVLQWSRENTGDWVVRYDPDQSLGQPPVPGSTMDLQRQRAAQYQSVPIPGVTDVELDIPLATQTSSTQQSSDPGSLIDQGLAASGRFTGNWLIQDPDGNTIHRFGGVGNSQGDANNFAIRWLRQNPRYVQKGVTVSPEMS